LLEKSKTDQTTDKQNRLEDDEDEEEEEQRAK